MSHTEIDFGCTCSECDLTDLTYTHTHVLLSDITLALFKWLCEAGLLGISLHQGCPHLTMPVSRHCLTLNPAAGAETASFAIFEALQPFCDDLGALGSGLMGNRGILVGVAEPGVSTIARGSSSRGRLRTMGECSSLLCSTWPLMGWVGGGSWRFLVERVEGRGLHPSGGMEPAEG